MCLFFMCLIIIFGDYTRAENIFSPLFAENATNKNALLLDVTKGQIALTRKTGGVVTNQRRVSGPFVTSQRAFFLN